MYVSREKRRGSGELETRYRVCRARARSCDADVTKKPRETARLALM
jgi:hypothetical protein